jgi:DNA-binding MarR family transcriptional regulator
MKAEERPHPEVELFLNVLRAEEHLRSGLASLLKDQGLSPPQYNVLRILRGVAPRGLRCQEIADRMITRVPDITRLLDRLDRSQLVSRRRGPGDHRVVITTLRRQGLQLLAELDRPLLDLHRRQLAGLSRQEIRQLNGLLVKLLRFQPDRSRDLPTTARRPS